MIGENRTLNAGRCYPTFNLEIRRVTIRIAGHVRKIMRKIQGWLRSYKNEDKLYEQGNPASMRKNEEHFLLIKSVSSVAKSLPRNLFF